MLLSRTKPARPPTRTEGLLVRAKGHRRLVIFAGWHRARKEIDLDLAYAPCAKLDVAGAKAVVRNGVSAPAELGDEGAGDGARRTLGKDASLRRARIGAVADRVDVLVSGFERARIDCN